MAKAKHSMRRLPGSAKAGKYTHTSKGGKLAHVRIIRPRIGPEDIDLRAVRRALREYFRTHPKALE